MLLVYSCVHTNQTHNTILAEDGELTEDGDTWDYLAWEVHHVESQGRPLEENVRDSLEVCVVLSLQARL